MTALLACLFVFILLIKDPSIPSSRFSCLERHDYAKRCLSILLCVLTPTYLYIPGVVLCSIISQESFFLIVFPCNRYLMFVINGQQLNCYNFPSCNVYYWVGEDTFIIHLSFTVVVKHRYDSLRVYKSTSFISTAIQVAEEAFIELENICHGSESL